MYKDILKEIGAEESYMEYLFEESDDEDNNISSNDDEIMRNTWSYTNDNKDSSSDGSVLSVDSQERPEEESIVIKPKRKTKKLIIEGEEGKDGEKDRS